MTLTDFDGTPLRGVLVKASGMSGPSAMTNENGVAVIQAETYVGEGLTVDVAAPSALRGLDPLDLREERVRPDRIWVSREQIIDNAWTGSYQFRTGKRVTGNFSVQVDDPAALNEAQQIYERNGFRRVFLLADDVVGVGVRQTDGTYTTERLPDVPSRAFVQSGRQVVEVPVTVASQTDVVALGDMSMQVLPSNRPISLTTLPDYQARMRDGERLMSSGLTLIRTTDRRMWTFSNSTFGRLQDFERDPMVEPGNYIIMAGFFAASPSQLKVLDALAAGQDLSTRLPSVVVPAEGPLVELQVDVARVVETMKSLEPPAPQSR